MNSYERFRNPVVGDWTYNAERTGSAINSTAYPQQAWPARDEAIGAFLAHIDPNADETLVLLQYQECVDKKSTKWAGDEEFTDEKLVAAKRWRRVVAIEPGDAALQLPNTITE